VIKLGQNKEKLPVIGISLKTASLEKRGRVRIEGGRFWRGAKTTKVSYVALEARRMRFT